jgi:hypothetical protein
MGSLAASRAWPAAAVGLSLVLASLITVTNASRFGDLSSFYSDHVHHAHATWVFLHRPVAIYREPFGVARQGIFYPQEAVLWEDMPAVYPPGIFVLFAPLSLVGAYVPMSQHAFGVLGVLYTVVLAHLALVAVWMALEVLEPGARVLVALVSWLLLVRSGLQGFYDPAWVGCGAMMIRAMARADPAVALRWFAGAALLHFRAAPLAPLAIAAVLEATRGRRADAWPWTSLAIVGASLAVVVATFALMFPATAQFRSQNQSMAQLADSHLAIATLVSLLAIAVAARAADRVVAAMVGVCAVLAIVDYEPWWWHATILLPPALAVGAWRGARRPAVTRLALLLWLLCLQRLAFQSSPVDLFAEIVTRFAGAPR